MSRKIKKLLLCLLSYSVDIFNGRFLKGGMGWGMEVRCYIYLHMTITLKQFLSKLITSLTCFGSFFFNLPIHNRSWILCWAQWILFRKKNRTITEEIETLFTYGENEQISQQKSEVLGSRSLRPRVCSTMVFIRKEEWLGARWNQICTIKLVVQCLAQSVCVIISIHMSSM